jgi:hypothetical protein
VTETYEPHLIGDGWDAEELWTPRETAAYLSISTKRLYDLPVPRIRLSTRRIRYRPATVRAYVAGLEKQFA